MAPTHLNLLALTHLNLLAPMLENWLLFWEDTPQKGHKFSKIGPYLPHCELAFPFPVRPCKGEKYDSKMEMKFILKYITLALIILKRCTAAILNLLFEIEKEKFYFKIIC